MIVKQFDKNFIKLPAIGQGMGAYSWDDSQIEILQSGIELGSNFIDTAEEYDNGRSEEIIGKAIDNIRDKVIIGTKFSPQHNSFDDVLKSAEKSLKRLKTDYIDLYQVHWPNPSIPLKETMSAMEKLVEEEKIKYIGVSNFSLNQLKEAQSYLVNEKIASLQIEYSLFDRMIEKEILPFCKKNKILIIAYSPLDRGRIVDGLKQRELIKKMADKYHRTPSQIALRWIVDKSSIIAIPKASKMNHLKENVTSTDFNLEEKDVQKISNICYNPIEYIHPNTIKVSLYGQDNKKVYQTLEEAKENKLGFVPSPIDISKKIFKEKVIKPVRLTLTSDENAHYVYDLIEGRIRYWAWVIAYGNTPIPAYIRKDWVR